MAENLIATHWEDRNAQPGFGYAGGVQDILTAYNGLHHRGANNRYAEVQSLMEEQIQYLLDLKHTLQQQEEEFFTIFGLNGDKKSDSFKILKGKIEEWNATGAEALINDASRGNKFYSGLAIAKKFAVFAEIPEEKWDALIDTTFAEEKVQEEIKETLKTKPETNIAEILNRILDKKTFSTNAKSTLLISSKIYLDSNGNVQVSIDKGKITPSLQLKLTKELEEYLNAKEIKVKPNYDFTSMFMEIFDVFNISAEGQKYIRMALNDYSNVLGSYAFNSSDSQIKGFLGEVYNNAFLYFMAHGNKAKKEAIDRITPTGVVLNTKNQEVVIDTWLDGLGIQVKNYEKNKIFAKGYNVHKTYDAGTFITDVLQIPTGNGTSNYSSIGNILLNLFASFDYNQDYGKEHPVQITPAYQYFKKTRYNMHNQLENTTNFTETFLPYIGKILGIDKIFSGEEVFIGKEQVYHNTFFNISGNYIPSSVIVQGIIDALNVTKSNQMESFISAHFSTKHTLSGKEKWRPDVTNETVQNIFDKRVDYANSSRISYSITLDIDTLVNRIVYK